MSFKNPQKREIIITNIQNIRRFFLFSSLIVLSACAAQRPLLYPNYHLDHVGAESAEADIDECMERAVKYGAKSETSREVAKDTAENAAVGGAAGAAAGAVFGDVGKGAGAGAAGAGAATVTRGVIRSGEPDPLFKRFVEKCLRDKGYAPIGWK